MCASSCLAISYLSIRRATLTYLQRGDSGFLRNRYHHDQAAKRYALWRTGRSDGCAKTVSRSPWCRFNINTVPYRMLFPTRNGIVPQMGRKNWEKLVARRARREAGPIIDPLDIVRSCKGIGVPTVASWMPLFSFLPPPSQDCPCWRDRDAAAITLQRFARGFIVRAAVVALQIHPHQPEPEPAAQRPATDPTDMPNIDELKHY